MIIEITSTNIKKGHSFNNTSCCSLIIGRFATPSMRKFKVQRIVKIKTLASNGLIFNFIEINDVIEPAIIPAQKANDIENINGNPNETNLTKTTEPKVKTPSTDKSGNPANRKVNIADNVTRENMLVN